jgi:hypothetical protein
MCDCPTCRLTIDVPIEIEVGSLAHARTKHLGTGKIDGEAEDQDKE